MSAMLPMLGLLAASAPNPGQPPTDFAGLTLWYDGETSPHYTAWYPPGPATDTHGAVVQRIDTSEGLNRCLSTNTVISGESILRNLGLRDVQGAVRGFTRLSNSTSPKGPTALMVSTRPTANADLTWVPASSLFTASTKIMMVALRFDADLSPGSDPGPGYGVHLVRIAHGYAFLEYVRLDGSANVRVRVGNTNSSGTINSRRVDVPVGQWAVITAVHASGQIKLRANAGAWSTGSSGNTFDWANRGADPVTVGFYVQPGTVHLAQLCFFNQARSDAELLQIERFLAARVGLSL